MEEAKRIFLDNQTVSLHLQGLLGLPSSVDGFKDSVGVFQSTGWLLETLTHTGLWEIQRNQVWMYVDVSIGPHPTPKTSVIVKNSDGTVVIINPTPFSKLDIEKINKIGRVKTLIQQH